MILGHDFDDLVQSLSFGTIFKPEVKDLVAMFVPIGLGDLPSTRFLVMLRVLDDSVGHIQLGGTRWRAG